MYLLVICTSSVKCLFRSFTQLLIRLFGFVFFFSCYFLSSLYILDASPLSGRCWLNFFSHSVGCPFILPIIFFAVEKKKKSFWIFAVPFTVLAFLSWAMWVLLDNHPCQRLSVCLLVFVVWNFLAFHEHFNPFWIGFYAGWDRDLVSCPPVFVGGLSFRHLMFLASWLTTGWRWVGLFLCPLFHWPVCLLLCLH